MRFLRNASAFVFLVVLSASPAFAQTNRGAIAGAVTDPTGAVVPGATVSVRNQQTGIQATAATTSSGDYRLPELPLGTYDVTVTATGFQTGVQQGVIVSINTTATVNMHLQPGTQAQTVTVTADLPGVETQTSEIGTTVTPRQVEDLPLSLGGVGAFRSPEAFVFLTPGATGPGSGGSSNGIYLSKISGSENFGNEDLLDGISAVRPDNGSTFDETSPSVEAIQEFRVITSTPSAPFGRSTGGVISFGTKSGANKVHGAAFDILRNTWLDANSWFNNGNRALTCAPGDAACAATYARPKDIKNDFGGSFNGPVYLPRIYNGRDKTFFFFAWEQLRWPRSSVTNSEIPTLAERGGDFSDRLTTTPLSVNACGATVYAGEIFDPQSTNTAGCRTAFPGNIIPTARISAVAAKVLSYLPAPNVTGSPNYNFSLRSSFPTSNTTYTVRIDHSIGSRDRLFADYSTRENFLLTGGNPVLPAPLDPDTWNQDFITHYGRVGWDHTFSPTLLNHLGVGYNRFNSQNNSAAVGLGQNWGTVLGLGNVAGPVFPQFNVGESFVSMGQQRGDDDISNVAIITDTVTLSKGRHTLSFGFDTRFYQYNNLAYDNSTGNYNFARGETTAANDPILKSQGGNSFASFLLGATDSANLLVYPHYPRYTTRYNAAFVQDDVRFTSKLTLNLGLRWSVDTPRSEAKNFTSNFNPTLPNPGAANRPGALEFGTNCNCNTKWANTYWKDFGPRVGFAFTPYANGLTVFRGGYGILYGPQLYSDFGNSLNAGYAVNANPVSPDSNFTPAFNFQNGFPSYGPVPDLDPSLRNGSSIDYVQPQYGSPAMVQLWSFQVQQQLATDLIFSIGYVGNHATRERTAAGFGNVNDIRLSSFALGSILNSNIGSPAAVAAGYTAPYPGFVGTVGDSLRPFPQYRRVNADCCLENDGQTTFHALEASLSRNFHNGLTLLVSYTWQKTLTDSDSMLPGQNGGGGLYQNPYNLKQEKALSSQDIPHTFVASYVYDLPIGRGSHFMNRGGVLNEVLGGWQVSGIQRYQSGQPLPFYCGGGIPGYDNCIRFNAVPGQSVYNSTVLSGGFNPFTQPYLNRAFFVDPNANRGNGPYQFGTLPRVTSFRMQHFLDESFGIGKRFAITEGAQLTIRGDAFNAFNRHIFSEPYDLGPNDPNFGFVNSTIDTPRQLQVTARVQF